MRSLKGLIIATILFLIFMNISYALPNWISLPEINRLDRIIDASDFGANLVNTGYNITAEFFFGNASYMSGRNPFDQSLNTTDAPIFAGLKWVSTELVTNGGFDTDSDWINGGFVIAGGVATGAGGASPIKQDIRVVIGNTYQLTFTMGGTGAGTTASLGGVTGTVRTSAGTYTELFTVTDTTNLSFSADGPPFMNVNLDNIEVINLTNQFVIDTNYAFTDRRLGIGLIEPNESLHLINNVDSKDIHILVQNTGLNKISGIRLDYGSVSNIWDIESGANIGGSTGYFSINTSSNPYPLKLTSNGHLSINMTTINPTRTLEIGGSGFFKGNLNVTDSIYADNLYVSGSDNNLLLGCGNLSGGQDDLCFVNDTIDSKLATTTYYPTSFAELEGTLSGGNNLGNLSFYDGQLFNITEGGGGSPMDFRINFTNVSNFNNLIFREYYIGSSSHTIIVYIWEYDDLVWEEYGEFQGQNGFNVFNFFVGDADEHILNKTVQVRFKHIQNGISSHKLQVDYVQLFNGFGTTSTNIDTTEFLTIDGRRPLTNNWNAEKNITAPIFKYLNAPVECSSGFFMTKFNGTHSVCTAQGYNSSDDMRSAINDSSLRLDELKVNGDLNVTGNISNVPLYFTCGENAVLDPGAEWSCGGNGETGQYYYIWDDVKATGMALYCNTGTGTAVIRLETLAGGDTGCSLTSTTTADATVFNCDIDAGNWIRPYTVSDTGHSQCVVTMRYITR